MVIVFCFINDFDVGEYKWQTFFNTVFEDSVKNKSIELLVLTVSYLIFLYVPKRLYIFIYYLMYNKM